jgi:Tfp pilus assembly protein PilE
MTHGATAGRSRGQGMTEYIIIVALIAIGAIAVYLAFGDVVRGQTATIAATLAGESADGERELATGGARRAGENAVRRDLSDYDAEAQAN